MEKLLRDTLIMNPELPVKFFCSEDCNMGEYPYEENTISEIRVEKVTLHNDKYMDKEEVEEALYDVLYLDYELEQELKERVDEEVTKKEFKEIICVFFG